MANNTVEDDNLRKEGVVPKTLPRTKTFEEKPIPLTRHKFLSESSEDLRPYTVSTSTVKPPSLLPKESVQSNNETPTIWINENYATSQTKSLKKQTSLAIFDRLKVKLHKKNSKADIVPNLNYKKSNNDELSE